MADKVQKIREEVERLKSQLLRCACSSQIAMETYCKEEAYNEVLSMLDTLQEEPVSDECIYNRTLEERQRSCKFCSAACQVRIKEEPVSEELEEAAKKHAVERYKATRDMVLAEKCKWSFKEGAEWKKEKMMAKAIDGDITFDYYGDGDKTYGCIAHDSFCLEDFGLKDGDKVKVIIIKEGLNYE